MWADAELVGPTDLLPKGRGSGLGRDCEGFRSSGEGLGGRSLLPTVSETIDLLSELDMLFLPWTLAKSACSSLSPNFDSDSIRFCLTGALDFLGLPSGSSVLEIHRKDIVCNKKREHFHVPELPSLLLSLQLRSVRFFASFLFPSSGRSLPSAETL